MNHSLPIEKGRYYDIEKSQRKCHLCQSDDLGDEYHYLLECNCFVNARKNTYILYIIIPIQTYWNWTFWRIPKIDLYLFNLFFLGKTIIEKNH